MLGEDQRDVNPYLYFVRGHVWATEYAPGSWLPQQLVAPTASPLPTGQQQPTICAIKHCQHAVPRQDQGARLGPSWLPTALSFMDARAMQNSDFVDDAMLSKLNKRDENGGQVPRQAF